METPLSPHLSISLAIAVFAAVGLIAYVLARSLPRAVNSLSRQQQLAGPRTDNPYENILTKAELLLTYAADNGIEVGEPERRAIYNFRLTDKKDQNPDIVDALYLAYMNLSKAVTPRTAESITETSLERNRGVQKYRKIAVILSLFVIPFSVLSFVSSAISTKIGQEIDDGNSLILQLRDGLGPNFAENKEKLNNSDIIMKTQQLSTTMRAIHETGNEIGYTLFGLMPPTPPSPTAIPAGLECSGNRHKNDSGIPGSATVWADWPRPGGGHLWGALDVHTSGFVRAVGGVRKASRTIRAADQNANLRSIGSKLGAFCGRRNCRRGRGPLQ